MGRAGRWRGEGDRVDIPLQSELVFLAVGIWRVWRGWGLRSFYEVFIAGNTVSGEMWDLTSF